MRVYIHRFNPDIIDSDDLDDIWGAPEPETEPRKKPKAA